jgi:hypothetical protein
VKSFAAFAAVCAFGLSAAQFAHAEASDVPSAPNALHHPTFNQVDSNGDGKVTREEAEAAGLDIDWNAVDSDGTGSLTQEEYDIIFLDQSPSSPSNEGINEGDSNFTDHNQSPSDGGFVDDGLDDLEQRPGHFKDNP